MSFRRMICASLLAVAGTASAQTAPATTATNVFDPATAPHVLEATGSALNHTAAGLGDRLTVKVRNFPALLAKVPSCHAIILFLDGLPLRDMPPESCNPYDGTVRYYLDRVPGSNDTEWHRLLGSPKGFTRRTRVSVGADDQFAYPTDVMSFKLKIIPGPQFYLFLGLLVFGTVLFVYLCRTTTIIRAPADPDGPGARPYSLSRFQMAFWFFMVIFGYVFMWLITGELDTITDSVLALLGLGAGTALGAALIDSAPSGTATVTTATTAGPAADPTATVTSVVAPMPPAPPHASQGFLLDILSDAGDGISIHRFQMFAWTLVLGGIFVGSVYTDLAMPEFNVTLLGLMGISSGTYLGFKFPEKKQANQAAAQATSTTTTKAG
jgi:hypothetical protein